MQRIYKENIKEELEFKVGLSPAGCNLKMKTIFIIWVRKGNSKNILSARFRTLPRVTFVQFNTACSTQAVESNFNAT